MQQIMTEGANFWWQIKRQKQRSWPQNWGLIRSEFKMNFLNKSSPPNTTERMAMFAQNVVVLYHRKNSHQCGSQFLIITWPFFLVAFPVLFQTDDWWHLHNSCLFREFCFLKPQFPSYFTSQGNITLIFPQLQTYSYVTHHLHPKDI